MKKFFQKIILNVLVIFIFGHIYRKIKNCIIKIIPGYYARRMIENAHGQIIELRKQKTEILDSSYPLVTIPNYENEIAIIEEKIKQWEEVKNLWSGKLDPSRNKLLWSIVVPLFISLIIPVLFYFFLE